MDTNGLTNHGDLEIWGDPLTIMEIRGNITNYGDLGMDEAEITGDVNNFPTATLHLDNTEIRGNLYNQIGAIIDVDYEVDVEQGAVENAGLIKIAPSGEIYVNPYLHNTGQLQMYGGFCGSDDLFHNDANGVIKGFGVLSRRQRQIQRLHILRRHLALADRLALIEKLFFSLTVVFL